MIKSNDGKVRLHSKVNGSVKWKVWGVTMPTEFNDSSVLIELLALLLSVADWSLVLSGRAFKATSQDNNYQ